MEESKNPTTSESAASGAPSAPLPARPAPMGDGPRGPRPERNGQRRGGRFSGPRPPKVCPFCSQKIKYIDYKSADQFRRYLTDHG